MLGGLHGREGAMGLGRGRMDGWQRGGESSRGGGRIGLLGGGRGGIVGRGVGGAVGAVGRGRGGMVGGGGITSSGIGPLTLVEGAKKLFQDVSGDVFDGIPASPHNANVLTGCALPHDRTATDQRADGSSDAACRVSMTDSSLLARAMTELTG